MSDYQRALKTSNRQRNLPAARITVGARRSIRYTPPASIPRLADGSPSDPRQLELMSRIDHAVYHAPLDSRPARPRKAGPVLGIALKAGERAMASDDLGAPKRPCSVAIPYDTQGGDRVVAIFGGLTDAQATASGGLRIPNGVADAYRDSDLLTARDVTDPSAIRGIIAAIGRAPNRERGIRVVLWPSELQRRGAAPIYAAESPRESYGYSRTETGRHAEALAA